MKIAIIGSGISGLVSAYLLHGDHEVTVFEANDYIGGHTHTVDVTAGERRYAVDTGFVVFNEVTYPNFCEILRRLGVAYRPAPMTFSVRCEQTGFEYNTRSLQTLFAYRKNIVSPSFYRMLLDIIRFRRELERFRDEAGESLDLDEYFLRRHFSRRFIEHFLVPYGASIWSTDPETFRQFPFSTLARFFLNHGFLRVRNPFPWLVIQGGSRRYVELLTAPFRERIRLSAPVKQVRRGPDAVHVITFDGRSARFDHVIIATHSDQALALLSDPTPQEREVLEAIPFQENRATLHTDTSVLPKIRSVWASWNYFIPSQRSERIAVTYDMNILQTITGPPEFCVTLNGQYMAQDKILGHFVYHHPVFRKESVPARKRHAEISGVNRTHYCGAYWGSGFHEDGVNSALAACRFFGKGL